MLVWTHKLSENDLEGVDIGLSNFFSGRKDKHSLNLIAACDNMCRFVDIGICYPGSTNYYLAFCTSDFIKKLESEVFLVPFL